MGRCLRTFVALRIGAEARDRLLRETEGLVALDHGLRVAGGGDLHLTLHFLGDTHEEDVPAVGEAVAAAGVAAAPIPVRYGGVDAFPDLRRPRVVVAEVTDEPRGAIAALAADVGRRLAPLGYPPERRPFRAHVTLGRLRSRPSRALVEAVEARRAADLGCETLSDLSFILSQPEGGRYHYIDLTRVRLGGGARERDPGTSSGGE